MVRPQSCPPEQEVEIENSWGPDKPCCPLPCQLDNQEFCPKTLHTDNLYGYPSMQMTVLPEELKKKKKLVFNH